MKKELTIEDKKILKKEVEIEVKYKYVFDSFKNIIYNLINSPYLNDKDFSINTFTNDIRNRNHRDKELIEFIKFLSSINKKQKEIKEILIDWKDRVDSYENEYTCDHLPSDSLIEIKDNIFFCERCGKVFDIIPQLPNEDINNFVDKFSSLINDMKGQGYYDPEIGLISNRYGGKGVISSITEDSILSPHTNDGTPVEINMSLKQIMNRMTDEEFIKFTENLFLKNIEVRKSRILKENLPSFEIGENKNTEYIHDPNSLIAKCLHVEFHKDGNKMNMTKINEDTYKCNICTEEISRDMYKLLKLRFETKR